MLGIGGAEGFKLEGLPEGGFPEWGTEFDLEGLSFIHVSYIFFLI